MLRTDLIDNLRMSAMTLNFTYVGLDCYVALLAIICTIVRHLTGPNYRFPRTEKILKGFFWKNSCLTIVAALSLLTFLTPLTELSMAASVFSFALLQLLARLAIGLLYYKDLKLSEAEAKRKAEEEAAEAEKAAEAAHTFV